MNLEWLKGMECTGVEVHPESSSIFRFGVAALVAESLWRISIDGILRLTSRDDGQRFGLPKSVDARATAQSLLEGHIVSDVRLDVRRGDLTLVLDGNTVLEVITESSGYESWSLRAPGKHVVAASGGTVQELPPEV
jgi:hypothetical protein